MFWFNFYPHCPALFQRLTHNPISLLRSCQYTTSGCFPKNIIISSFHYSWQARICLYSSHLLVWHWRLFQSWSPRNDHPLKITCKKRRRQPLLICYAAFLLLSSVASRYKVCPCGLATSLDIGLSNLSLKTITLSFYSEFFSIYICNITIFLIFQHLYLSLYLVISHV
jgi:hypothetical protein